MTSAIRHRQRREFRTLLTFFALMATPLPAPAATSAVMSLDKAVVRAHEARPDLVHVAGGLYDFSVDGTEFVTVVLAGIDYRAALSAFTVKGQTLRYRDKSAVPRLSRMRLNLQRHRFALTLRRIELGPVRSPLTLEVETEASVACARVPLVEKTLASASREARSGAGAHAHSRASRPAAPDPTLRLFELASLPPESSNVCDVGAATLEPEQLLVGDPSAVRVAATVTGTPVAGSVQLTQADAVGAPQGPALCTLADDGQGADSVAGDGVFSCTIQVDTSVPAQLSLVVSATLGGAEVRSATSGYRVVEPLTDADAETIVQVQELAEQTWTAKEAAYGDTLQARTETMAVLQTLPGVDRVTLSSETGSIAIYYSSGVIGGLGLEPRLPPRVALTPAPAPRSAGRNTAEPVADPPPDNAIVVGNRKVLIWDRDDDDRQYCVQIDTHGYTYDFMTIQPPPYEYRTTLWEDYCLQLQADPYAPTPQECGDWLQGKWIVATAGRSMPVPVSGTCEPWVLCSLADAIERSEPVTHWTFTARWATAAEPCVPGGFLGGP